MDDSHLEEILMGRAKVEMPSELGEARDFLEKLLLPGLAAQGRSPAEARVEAMNLVGKFQYLAFQEAVTTERSLRDPDEEEEDGE
jgi:hypothetical protein